MMETKVTQLPMANEIASVMVAKRCLEDRNFLAKIKADPVNVFDQMPARQQVRTVQNTPDLLHVGIPGYGFLANKTTLDRVSDEQMADVSGGIFFLFAPLFALAGAGAATAAAVTAGVGVGIAASQGAFDEDTGMYDVGDP